MKRIKIKFMNYHLLEALAKIRKKRKRKNMKRMN